MRVRSWPGLALAWPLWPGFAEGQGQGQTDCGPALEGQGQVRKNWAGPGPDRTSDSLVLASLSSSPGAVVSGSGQLSISSIVTSLSESPSCGPDVAPASALVIVESSVSPGPGTGVLVS